jgi:hypothetical protein
MRERNFRNNDESMEAARGALGLFEDLGYKYACVTTNQEGEVSVVFLPNIDGASNNTIGFYYPLDLNRETVTEKLAEAIGQGADYSKAIPGTNCIPKEVLDRTRKL